MRRGRKEWQQSDLQMWQIQARQQQNRIFQNFGTEPWWQGTPHPEDMTLHRALSYILFGTPPIQGRMSLRVSGYTAEELKIIQKFVEHICGKFKEHTCISVVFVLTKLGIKNETEGVIRVWDSNKTVFLDANCKEYRDWKKYLEHNTLPKRYICYPQDGYYILNISMQLALDFGTTPNFHRIFHAKKRTWIELFFFFMFLLAIALYVSTATTLENDGIFYSVASFLFFISLGCMWRFVARFLCWMFCCRFICNCGDEE